MDSFSCGVTWMYLIGFSLELAPAISAAVAAAPPPPPGTGSGLGSFSIWMNCSWCRLISCKGKSHFQLLLPKILSQIWKKKKNKKKGYKVLEFKPFY